MRAADGSGAPALREPADSMLSLAWALPLRLGKCLRNGLGTMGPGLLSSELVNPFAWARLSLSLARRSTEGLRLLPEGKALLALRELRNKAEVFCLVLEVGSLIGVPRDPPFPLLDLVGRAYALDPFAALWAVEGLGHDYGESRSRQTPRPHGILAGESTGALPAKSLLMLHAGIGLAFAQALLTGGERMTEADLSQAVLEIVRLCRNNSRGGYAGAAYESLGLVTRTFHPGLVPVVDRILREAEPELLGYFWHGAGRAHYFLPVNLLPCSVWEAFRRVQIEAPEESSRRSAVAGAAWAFALVSQRDPEIMARLLVEPHGEELLADGAFANGVASATIMRQDSTPEAPFLAPFWEHQPEEPAVARLWQSLVRGPCEAASRRWYPVLRRRGVLGEVFRYQDLGALAARLEGAP